MCAAAPQLGEPVTRGPGGPAVGCGGRTGAPGVHHGLEAGEARRAAQGRQSRGGAEREAASGMGGPRPGPRSHTAGERGLWVGRGRAVWSGG